MIRPLVERSARVVAQLTAPLPDAEHRDRLAEQVAAASSTGRLLVAASAAVGRAWRHSRTARVAGWCSVGLAAQTRAERLRSIAAVILISACTTLVLRLFATRREPLIWIVPVAAGVISLLVLVLSRHFANAMSDKRL